jgi:hypothetical protein
LFFFSIDSICNDEIGPGAFSSIKLILSSAVTTNGGGFFVSIFIFARFQTDEYYFHDCLWPDAAVFTLSLLSFYPFFCLNVSKKREEKKKPMRDVILLQKKKKKDK